MKLTIEMHNYLVSTIRKQRSKGRGTSDTQAQKMYERFCKKFNLGVGDYRSESCVAFLEVMDEVVKSEL